jgi:hypothetical protein
VLAFAVVLCSECCVPAHAWACVRLSVTFSYTHTHTLTRGKSGGKDYECKLEFLRKIKKEVRTHSRDAAADTCVTVAIACHRHQVASRRLESLLPLACHASNPP